MKNPIEIWEVSSETKDFDLDHLQPFFCNLGRNMYLLDTQKASFTLLEKYVYDIALFHFERWGLPFDHEQFFIEFWWKMDAELNNFHMDCDVNARVKDNKIYEPLLSNILYLDDSKYPTMLTNLTHEQYKYKEFEGESDFTLSFPKKGKMISFHGSYYHGATDIFVQTNNSNLHQCKEMENGKRRTILVLNLWDRKPKDIDYYNGMIPGQTYSTEDIQFRILPSKENTARIPTHEICEELFEELLYQKQSTRMHTFGEQIKNSLELNSTFLFYKSDKESSVPFPDGVKDTEEIHKIVPNRFFQRFIFDHFFPKEKCEWIIKEYEKSDTNTNIEKMPAVFKFVLTSMQETILPKWEESYQIQGLSLDIRKLLIIKCGESMSDIPIDAPFVIQIALSDFEKEEILFEDGMSIGITQGAMVFHSGKMTITTKDKYMLVAYINCKME